MFCTQAELILAGKEHVCTWCAEKILKGEQYYRWASVDDTWYTSKMHVECRDACLEDHACYGDNEYMPYNNERPNKNGDD